MPGYKVIGYPMTRAMRVIWMLEELGESYEVDPCKPHSDTALGMNPSGKVPGLLVDGEPLLDSIAIVQYLADSHGKLTYPAGTFERARQDGFTQFCADEIEGPLWVAAKHSFVYPEEMRVPGVKEVCRMEFGRALGILETRLGANAFVMGEEFTVPDLLIGHCASWAKAAKFELPGGRVAEYLDRVLSRPALARAGERAREIVAAAA
jgi:glutathione S-transferase